MSEIFAELIGQQVELASTDGISVVGDVGILDAYDGRVVRLRKEGELLYFPLENVHSIAGAATTAGSSPPLPATTGGNLLGELVGQKVDIFPNPHTARIEGVLEAVDGSFRAHERSRRPRWSDAWW